MKLQSQLFGTGLGHVEFQPRDRVGPTLGIHVSDQDPNARWRLIVKVLTEREGGHHDWDTLGTVITTPPRLTATQENNRVVAIAFCPGALNWRVDVRDEGFTPPGGIPVEISLSTSECCTSFPGVVPVGDASTVPGTIVEGPEMLHFATLAATSAFAVPAGTAPGAWVDETSAAYRFVPGDLTPADGWRVLASATGRWILDGDAITLAPIGGVGDDGARITSAAAALAYLAEVRLAEAAFLLSTPIVLVSGVHLSCGPGTVLHQNLAPATGDPRNAALTTIFANGAASTLAAATVEGAITCSVNAAIVAAGDFLELVDASTGSFRVALYQVRAVAGAGPFTVTLDRPIRMAFPINSPAWVALPIQDARVEGHGAEITGTGDRAIELIGTWNCEVTDFRITPRLGTPTERLTSIDSPSYRCAMRRLYGDANNASTICHGFESGEANVLEECVGYRASISAFVAQDAQACEFRNCRGYESNVGITVLAAAGNFVGAADTLIHGGNYDRNGFGLNVKSATRTRSIGVSYSYNTSDGSHAEAAPDVSADTVFVGCRLSKNGGAGLVVDAQPRTRLTDSEMLGNGATLAVVAGGSARFTNLVTDQLITCAGELDIEGLTADYPAGAGTPAMTAQNGGVLRVRNASIIARQAPAGNVLQANAGGAFIFDGVDLQLAAGNIGFVNLGSMSLENVRVRPLPAAAGTIGIFPAAGSMRIEQNVNAAACATPLFTPAPGFVNVGQVVGQVAPLALAFADARVNDKVWVTLTIPGGAPAPPQVVVTPGVGFTFTFGAGDTSTYDFRLL